MFYGLCKIVSAAYLVLCLPFWVFWLSLDIPKNNQVTTGLVLGASVIGNRQPSSVLQKRLDKAVELYTLGKLDRILVSGDNRNDNYNEPRVMQNYLYSKGIPTQDILTDAAGVRTLDSCQRAKTVFNLESVTIITQAFHLPRATFLCKQAGLSTTGVPAEDSSINVATYGFIREIPASYLALQEVFLPRINLPQSL